MFFVNSRSVIAFLVVRRGATRASISIIGSLSAVSPLGDVAVAPDPYLYESAELAVSWVTAGKSLTATSAKRSAAQNVSVRNASACPVAT